MAFDPQLGEVEADLDDAGVDPEPEPEPFYAQFNPETQAQIQAYAQQHAETLAAQQSEAARVEERAKFQRVSGVHGNLLKNLQQEGFVVDKDTGKFARPPAAATPAPTAPAPPVGATAVPTFPEADLMYTDPAEYRRQVESYTDWKADQKVKPLQEQFRQMEGYMSQQAAAGSLAGAKATLVGYGLPAALADTTEYQAAYRSLVEPVGLEQRTPLALRTAAMMAVTMAQDQLGDERWNQLTQPAPAPAPTAAPRATTQPQNPSRAALTQTGTPRGGATPAEQPRAYVDPALDVYVRRGDGQHGEPTAEQLEFYRVCLAANGTPNGAHFRYDPDRVETAEKVLKQQQRREMATQRARG